MSTETEKKAEKKVRCEITELVYLPSTQQVSCKVKMTGKIKSEDKWAIENAETQLTLAKVQLRDLLGRLFIGWFWVRKIQDVLRKGTIAEARARLNKGYDWTEETTTRKEAEKAPAPVVAERALDKMTPEEIRAFLTAANAKYGNILSDDSDDDSDE